MAEGSVHTTRNFSYRRKKKEEAQGTQQQRKKNEAPFASSPQPFFLGLGALLLLTVLYGAFFWVVHRSVYTMHIKPLPLNASLDKFSEGRTMKHIWHLADEIGIRQEGSPGLTEAAKYIKTELESYRKRSSPNLRVDIDETLVNGSFNMVFLKHSIALAYRNHTNIAIRISASGADDDAAAVLVNGHFDSAIGSPGAGDCASCIASMLELVRLIIDTDWVPPSPIIFLFNGAEELFMLACHGFMTSHKWRSSVGALINLESSGTSGPDLVCQSGPGSWPAEVYADAAIYPMANTAAQDIFPIFPGDTDFRMFSEDYGDIPGLDIILLLESYIYHTPYDKPERMAPGSMQVRGENLVSLLRAFTNSSKLLNAKERAQQTLEGSGANGRRPVFFDFLGWFMVIYPFKVAMALHVLPLSIVMLVSSITSYKACGVHDVTGRLQLVLKGWLIHVCGMILGVIFPIFLAISRLLASSTAMTWFAQPWLACLMFMPIAIVGMLLPRTTIAYTFLGRENAKKSTNQKAVEWGLQWGAFTFYSLGAAFGTYFVVGNGFLSFLWTLFILAAQYIFGVCQRALGKRSLLLLLLYILVLAIPIMMSLYIGEILWQVVHEKMGMSGSVPQPYGFFVPDIIMAAATGYSVVLCLGPVIPVAGRWLASPHLSRFLLYLSIGSAAVSAQFFPYSEFAPKRVLLQHTIQTEGNHIMDSSFDLAVFDANSLPFVLKHVPKISEVLKMSSTFDYGTAARSPSGTWMALYPIPSLFSESFRFPAESKSVLKHHPSLPHLHLQAVEAGHYPKSHRTYLELDLGSLEEVWVAVINVTGPLVSWSFSNEQLPAPESVNGGPLSYICRLSGRDHNENWKFWLEAEKPSSLRVDLAVFDQQIEQHTRELATVFPPWAAVIAASSYISSYSL